MSKVMSLTMFMISVVVALVRVSFIHSHALSWPGTYEAFAHIWVGMLLALWIFRPDYRSSAAEWLIIITVIEVVMYLVQGGVNQPVKQPLNTEQMYCLPGGFAAHYPTLGSPVVACLFQDAEGYWNDIRDPIPASAAQVIAYQPFAIQLTHSEVTMPEHADPGIVRHLMLPDPHLTPGMADQRVSQSNIHDTICKSGYTATVRDVSHAEKSSVLKAYGLTWTDIQAKVNGKTTSLAEFDHYWSLELGGANDPSNIWPQFYDAAPGQSGYFGAREKDVVETYLGHEVCADKITLVEARLQIADWPTVYIKIKK